MRKTILMLTILLSTTGVWSMGEFTPWAMPLKGTGGNAYGYVGSFILPLEGGGGYGGNIFIFDKITTGILNPAAARQITLYPNPAAERLTITVPAEAQATAYTIHSLIGNVVTSGNMNGLSGTTTISIRHLPAQVYLVRITDKQGTILLTGKFIKE